VNDGVLKSTADGGLVEVEYLEERESSDERAET